MTEYSEAQVWSAIRHEYHPSLPEREKSVAGYMSIVEELFPGINYYSISGFVQIMKDYVQPVLRKLFPDLENKPATEVSRERTVTITAFLPSEEYEHLESPRWKKRLEELLVE